MCSHVHSTMYATPGLSDRDPVHRVGYVESSGRYIGLWTPEDKGAAPSATDWLLLVRPDVAA